MIPPRVVVFQTAFLGDVILTLPLASALRRSSAETRVAMVTTPAAAAVVEDHEDVALVIPYDKHGSDRGLAGAMRIIRSLRAWGADLALVPHRSLRSAIIVRLAGIPRRIGFSTSAGRALFTDKVLYRRAAHEIDRNLDLLIPLGLRPADRILPTLRANVRDQEIVDHLIRKYAGVDQPALIAVAPGSVWATKRWTKEGFIAVCREFAGRKQFVALVGGAMDRELCDAIAVQGGNNVVSFAGELTLKQSAALIGRSQVLLTNDSAPEHLALAVGTPVVAIFGPTVPAFGFAPVGRYDEVVEYMGLTCRPCGIHGGDVCPIGTLDCMKLLPPQQVISAIDRVINRSKHSV